MSVINTNVQSLIAQRALAQNNQTLNTSLNRLSTGLKINSGADDPSGLIASQNLQAEQTGIQAALNNAQQAGNVIGTAEGGLSEVSTLLNQLQGLVSQSVNTGALSSQQISANQQQVDSILSTINSIAQATSFQGKQLLNGSLAYITSGVTTADISNLQVNSASFAAGTQEAVTVNVTQSAQTATFGQDAGAGLASATTIQIAGNLGTQQISLATGSTAAQIVAAVNGVSSTTGVSATVSGGTGVKFNSTDFGSNAFVSVNTLAGTFAGNQRATGLDATVLVNGTAAQVAGLDVSFSSTNLDVSFSLKGINTNTGTTAFTITGGGANFSLGSTVTQAGIASIGVSDVSVGSLGGVAGNLSSLGSGQVNALSSNNLVNSQKIVSEAIQQISELRGRLGAFQDFTIGATVNSLNVAYENTSSAESNITDTNFAAETANLTRAQILSQSATTVLSQANAAPQQVLTLLKNA
jgi:flagellin